MPSLSPQVDFAPPPALQTTPSLLYFRFPFVMVQVEYGGAGASLAARAQGGAIGSELCEISVWLRADFVPEDYLVESFPYSPLGLPVPFATNEQLAAVLHWASLLLSAPPINPCERPRA